MLKDEIEESLNNLKADDEEEQDIIKQVNQIPVSTPSQTVTSDTLDDNAILSSLDSLEADDEDYELDNAIKNVVEESHEKEIVLPQSQETLYSIYNEKYPEQFQDGQLVNIEGAEEIGIITPNTGVPTGDGEMVQSHVSTRTEEAPFGYLYNTDTQAVDVQKENARADMSRVDKVSMDFDMPEMSDDEEDEMVENLIKEMPDINPDGSKNLMKGFLQMTGSSGFNFISALGKSFSYVGAGFTDAVEYVAQQAKDNMPDLYEEYMDRDPKEFAENVARGAGSGLEFSETLPVLGNFVKLPSASARIGRKLAKKAAKNRKKAEEAWNRKLNVTKMRNNTAEEIKEKADAAKEMAKQNKTISNKLIQEFEDRVGKTISTTDATGNKAIDYQLAREVGVETSEEVAGASMKLATGTDELMQPILKPDKLDALVAVTADLQKANPKAFNPNKKIIDNLFDLTVNKELLAGDELLDMLNKYNLSFEDYILTVVGSGSQAGKVLNKLSQIKRIRPANEQQLLNETKKTQGAIRQTIMRIENIRRGGLVSQLATASRNLTSAGIRAPLEGLGNVMDTALYNMSHQGYISGGKSLLSPANWKDSFRHMRYMFDNPKETKETVDFILEQPELAKQYDLLFNNINEIQKATGRGKGGPLDGVLSLGEDAVDVLNTPNRWQEYLVRRGAFLGELERLTKREYGIDLMDTLGKGKIRDLLNDASNVRPQGARSFTDIVADATNKALDVTYAKQPDIPVFRSTSNFIVRNGLTVVLPFPRFMFNSMELMGQYAGGAIIPLSRKVANIVTLGKVGKGKLTFKDRQRISRNVVGSLAGAPVGAVAIGKLLETEEEGVRNDISDGLLGIATIGAAYQYRTSSEAPSDYKQLNTGEGTVLDVTPQYPMRQFMYIGEAIKRTMDGTLDDWFNVKEFNETFIGTNLRTGVGQSIINDIVALAEGSDLTKGEAIGKSLGGALGNYLSTWAVPFAQVIEAQRAVGKRGLTYKDVAEDPTLDFQTTFMQELERPFRQRGFTVTAEEEEKAPKREFLFQQEKKRVSPISRVLFGLNLSTADSAEGEYLKELGFTDYELGSRSKVPSVKRFENKTLREALPTIVEFARDREDELKIDYENASDTVQKKFTEKEYVFADVRPIIDSKIKSIKTLIAKGSVGETTDYVKALTKYRKLKKADRKKARVLFMEENNKVPNALSEDDLNELFTIGKTFGDAIR